MEKFNYGGQAVIEGVMMRGSKVMAIAVREPKGKIVVHSEPLNTHVYSGRISRWPFIRALTMLWDTLGLGMRSLMYSADVALGEENAEFSGPLGWGTVAVSLLLGIGLFFVMPSLLVSLVDRWLPSSLLSNLIEGTVRLALILLYIWGVGFIPDIRRVFAYHGAEHKTINAYEDGAPLTPQGVAAYTTAHPRCGTSFLLVVAVIAVLVFALLGRPALWIRLISRVLLIPVIAGLSYEVIRFSAAHRHNPLMRAILAPGLWLQQLTTREPELPMLEVAIAALQRVLDEEG
ncbi:MAG: DUF1385 domain-containing protein [Anaerolineae bacterium]|nr:DUF1385 domain-containing protein [Anaerolineae bacterium]MDH7473320.1 DUF1385 domain-containing protein [Anaerolineae bacterium]